MKESLGEGEETILFLFSKYMQQNIFGKSVCTLVFLYLSTEYIKTATLWRGL